jgi:hypothetical protein
MEEDKRKMQVPTLYGVPYEVLISESGNCTEYGTEYWEAFIGVATPPPPTSHHHLRSTQGKVYTSPSPVATTKGSGNNKNKFRQHQARPQGRIHFCIR